MWPPSTGSPARLTAPLIVHRSVLRPQPARTTIKHAAIPSRMWFVMGNPQPAVRVTRNLPFSIRNAAIIAIAKTVVSCAFWPCLIRPA